MKIKYMLSIALMTFIGSCGFLDEYSQDELKPSTTEDFDKILIGGGYANKLPNFIPYYDLLTDDIGTWDPVLISGEQPIEDINQRNNIMPFYEWNPDMFEITEEEYKNKDCNSWQKIYEVIKCCNVVICSVDDSFGSDEAKGYLKAQALGLRAFYYYLLINLYADPYNSGDASKSRGVPIIKQFSVDAKYPKPSSVEQVYEFMVEDVTEALSLIENNMPQHEVSPNRVSKAMLHNLAARIYMQMDRWGDVITHSEKVLEQKKGLLKLSNFLSGSALGTYSAKYRPNKWITYSEVGFQYNPEEYIWGYSNNESWEAFFNKPPVSYGYTGRTFGVSKELRELYETIIEFNDEGSMITKFEGDIRYVAFYNSGTSRASSFINNGSKKATSNSTAFGMRTAEAYLNLAEGLIRTNKSTEAFELLNTLRESRWKGAYTFVSPKSKEEDLKFCLEERRRELSFEHIRWFDLRRLGRPRLVHNILCFPGQQSEVVLEQGDPRYTLPIPKSVTDRNPELL